MCSCYMPQIQAVTANTFFVYFYCDSTYINGKHFVKCRKCKRTESDEYAWPGVWNSEIRQICYKSNIKAINQTQLFKVPSNLHYRPTLKLLYWNVS